MKWLTFQVSVPLWAYVLMAFCVAHTFLDSSIVQGFITGLTVAQ